MARSTLPAYAMNDLSEGVSTIMEILMDQRSVEYLTAEEAIALRKLCIVLARHQPHDLRSGCRETIREFLGGV